MSGLKPGPNPKTRTPKLLGDADEAAAYGCGVVLGVGCFGQIGDADAAEQVFDGVVYLAQWFFDGAMSC